MTAPHGHRGRYPVRSEFLLSYNQLELSLLLLRDSIGIAILLFMPLWAPRVSFWGLTPQATETNQNRNRFYLSDSLVLVSLISIVTASGANSRVGGENNWILIVSLNLLVICMWYRCNQLMDRSKITDNFSRMVMQLFVYPSSVVIVSFISVCTLSLVLSLASNLFPQTRDPTRPNFATLTVLLLVAWGWLYYTRTIYSGFSTKTN